MDKMKILLINPPIPRSYYNNEFYIPSSLVYLAAVLQRNGDEVKILDLRTFKLSNPDGYYDFYERILIDAVSNFMPELIGFGCLYAGHFPDILRFSILLKKNFKEIPIATGGIHPTICAFDILSNCPSIDWVVLGEGEKSIVQLVNTIKDKHYEFDKIDGLAFRKDGKAIVNPKANYIEDIDSIPFPAYDLINPKDYYVDTSNWHNPKNLPINTSIPIITSRSCPNRCTFCSMYMVMGSRWRSRSPQSVVDEIEYLYNKYGHRHFSFMDDNLTFKKAHILGICSQIIKRRLDIQFETPNGIALGTVDEEVMAAMVCAGMVRVALAVESGSDFIRNKIMRKNLARDKILEVVKLTKKYKQLNVAAFFIVGMPEETSETLAETYNMIKEIDVDRVFLQNVVPYPGTKVFDQALRDNLLVDTNVDKWYLTSDRYLTNYDAFFIKPYKLELKDLREFREKCKKLTAVKKPPERQSTHAYKQTE